MLHYVTLCYTGTRDVKYHTTQADIVVFATDETPELFDESYIREGAVVIDPGIYRIDKRWVGNVNYDRMMQRAGYITPVPGGVGPMTVVMLMQNTILAAERYERISD